MIKVIFSAALKSATQGESDFSIDFSGDISSLLGLLKDKYGESFERRLFENGSLRRYINLYVDGKDIRYLDGVKTKVSGASEIFFLPAVSGG